MTIHEKKRRLKGIRMAFVGDGNNVLHSLIEAAALTGINITIACPKGYEPDPGVLKKARASSGNGTITVVREPEKAAKDADVLYTDVMGQHGPGERGRPEKEDIQELSDQSGTALYAKKDAIVLHCMPAHRGEEITDEIMDSPQSAVFDQAENRLHTQKALRASADIDPAE